MQLTTEITDRLKKFVTEPVVDVTVLAGQQPAHLRDWRDWECRPAIPHAGHDGTSSHFRCGRSLLPYANKKGIYILRGDTGKQQKIVFDYNKALTKGDMQAYLLTTGRHDCGSMRGVLAMNNIPPMKDEPVIDNPRISLLPRCCLFSIADAPSSQPEA